MSWLFGWKKNQKGYASVAEEEGRPTDDNDEFEILNKPPQPGQSEAEYSASSLYPNIPPIGEFSSMTIDPAASQGESTRFINDIPFKLCKRLEIIKNNDFEISRLLIAEILAFIERLESSDYNYSFSLEEDVKAEMESASGINDDE